ncbi:unnamed protein product [Cercospora beticola]|nr:unnamed protein product [Cercospora beticola]
MTEDEERGFKEIENIWERLKLAEIVYDKHGTPVVSTGSGVEEIEEGKEEK